MQWLHAAARATLQVDRFSVKVPEAVVPEDLARRCRMLSTVLNLRVVGIDLRLARSGGWYCFEANPSPGFSFYEEAAGQPISEAVGRLLAAGR